MGCKHTLKQIKAIRKKYIYYKCTKCGDILIDNFSKSYSTNTLKPVVSSGE